MAVPAEVTSRHSRGATRDGLLQFRREWVAEAPKAVVLLVHGIGEHSGRYEHVGARFAMAGYTLVGIDLRGFGRSGGHRAWVADFGDYLDDVEDQLVELRRLGRPVVLLGHSMGGLIATRYAQSTRPQPDLLLLSAPAVGNDLPGWQAALPSLLSRVAPRARIPGLIEVDGLSRDPEVGAAYLDDPLVETSHTARLIAEVLAAMDDARDGLDRVGLPMLVIHGGDDELVPTEASAVFEGRDGVRRRVYPELRHEVFNELNWSDVVDDVLAWLDAQF